MMTLERASELVMAVSKDKFVERAQLFDHFVNYFNLDNKQIEFFAELCGYGIAKLAD